MPTADYSSYHQPAGTGGDGTKLDNFIDAVQTTVNGLDQNNFAAGKIFDNTKIMQGGATSGQALVWNGTSWEPTTTRISSSQTFADSGSTDFSSQGLWLVEVVFSTSTVIGTALVHIGANTNNGTGSITILGNGPNTGTGLNPVMSVVNNNAAGAAFRVATAGATATTITVSYRRIQ